LQATSKIHVLSLHTQGAWTEWVQNAPKATMHLGVKGEDLTK